MLKVLSSPSARARLHCLSSRPPMVSANVGEGRSQLLRVLRSLRSQRGGSSIFGRKAFFCSDSGDGSEPPSEAKAAEESEAVAAVAAEGGVSEEAESKASSAIVSMNPRPEDYMSVSFISQKKKSNFLQTLLTIVCLVRLYCGVV